MQEGARSANPSPVRGDVHVDVGGAGRYGGVQVMKSGHADLSGRFNEGGRYGMRIPRAAVVYRAAGPPPFIRAAFPILLFFEDRKHVSEGPSFRSVLSPPVEVALHAPRPHHGIDAAASAKYATEGHVEIAVVQLRQRGDGKVVIERPGDIVKPDARIHDGRCVVGSSRLYDKNLP